MKLKFRQPLTEADATNGYRLKLIDQITQDCAEGFKSSEYYAVEPISGKGFSIIPKNNFLCRAVCKYIEEIIGNNPEEPNELKFSLALYDNAANELSLSDCPSTFLGSEIDTVVEKLTNSIVDHFRSAQLGIIKSQELTEELLTEASALGSVLKGLAQGFKSGIETAVDTTKEAVSQALDIKQAEKELNNRINEQLTEFASKLSAALNKKLSSLASAEALKSSGLLAQIDKQVKNESIEIRLNCNQIVSVIFDEDPKNSRNVIASVIRTNIDSDDKLKSDSNKNNIINLIENINNRFNVFIDLDANIKKLASTYQSSKLTLTPDDIDADSQTNNAAGMQQLLRAMGSSAAAIFNENLIMTESLLTPTSSNAYEPVRYAEAFKQANTLPQQQAVVQFYLLTAFDLEVAKNYNASLINDVVDFVQNNGGFNLSKNNKLACFIRKAVMNSTFFMDNSAAGKFLGFLSALDDTRINLSTIVDKVSGNANSIDSVLDKSIALQYSNLFDNSKQTANSLSEIYSVILEQSSSASGNWFQLKYLSAISGLCKKILNDDQNPNRDLVADFLNFIDLNQNDLTDDGIALKKAIIWENPDFRDPEQYQEIADRIKILYYDLNRDKDSQNKRSTWPDQENQRDDIPDLAQIKQQWDSLKDVTTDSEFVKALSNFTNNIKAIANAPGPTNILSTIRSNI